MPSSVVILLRRGDLLASTRAAGTLLVSDSASPATRLAAGVCAHGAVSAFWGWLLWRFLPRRRTLAWGVVGGLGIAALDLGLVARRYPAIRQLPRGPQIADHVTFGLIVGGCRTFVHGRTNPTGTLAPL